ncbi:MAG: D-alanyl-D-alanine carboxypeptidase [Nitrospirae bacterium]|nr:D-alanyl-D-alanine carboxypeptidase [Nitrospirota bacterium]
MTKKHQRAVKSLTGPAGSKILGLLLAAALSLVLASPLFAQEVKSKAAVVMEAETGRLLYAKNPDLRLMPASTTKLMTALVVVERAKLSDVVTVSRRASLAAPTKIGLNEGDKVTIETLLYAALMKSANDAAVALAEAVGGSEEEFVKLMNRKAVAIGANDTRFINAHGLPGKGQYITAYDLTRIMRETIKYPVLKEIINTRMTEVSTETGKTVFITNTNKLLWSDSELMGGKTGFTRQARHCFVCAGERDKETIIVSLLGAPSRDLLWKESEELMTFGSKVIGKTEEPVIYLARADIQSSRASHAVYTTDENGGPGKVVKSKYKKSSKLSAHKKKGQNKKFAKKKSRKINIAKKKPRNRNIAKNGENGFAG